MTDTTADRLFSIIARTRFRAPGTSADPYTDSLILWLSVVHEIREVLEPLEHPKSALGAVETVYRTAIESWLRGDEPVTDGELHAELRRAIDQ